jgi:hypothetical protein
MFQFWLISTDIWNAVQEIGLMQMVFCCFVFEPMMVAGILSGRGCLFSHGGQPKYLLISLRIIFTEHLTVF